MEDYEDVPITEDDEAENIEKNILIMRITAFFMVLALLWICGVWQIPGVINVCLLNVPADCEDFLPLKSEFTTICVGTVCRSEKVVKYDGGADGLRDYIIENNPQYMTDNIKVYDFFAFSCCDTYSGDWGYDDIPVSERHKYVKIKYCIYY